MILPKKKQRKEKKQNKRNQTEHTKRSGACTTSKSLTFISSLRRRIRKQIIILKKKTKRKFSITNKEITKETVESLIDNSTRAHD